MDPTGAPPASTAPSTALSDIDQAALQRFLAQRKGEQNLGLGILGGVIGAALGATIWALITILTHFQIGWMAVGVGFLAGFGVRILGRGMEPVFGYVGAVLALIGCVAGNLLSVMLTVSSQEHIPFGLIASKLTPDLAWRMLSADFNVIDLLFYGLAIFAGYRYSFHHITAAELEAVRTRSSPHP